MNKKNIISLAGDLASGKGAVSKELAERLNYEIYRNGEYFRKLAKEHNMDVKRAFFDENRKSSENFNTVQEQKEDLQKRFKLENERYFELYNIHKEDLANYDLVINTSNITPAQVANVIIEEYGKWLNQ